MFKKILVFSSYFGIWILFSQVDLVTQILKCSATSQTQHRCGLIFILE